MSKPSHMMLISAMLGMGYLSGSRRWRDLPEERPCLNCGKPKQHNNSFCCKECCTEYKDKKREQRPTEDS